MAIRLSPTPTITAQPMADFIERCYSDRLTLRSASAAVRGRPSRLGRIFQSQVGLSVHEYITRVRLDHAAHLIASRMKIEAVDARHSLQPRGLMTSPSTLRDARFGSSNTSHDCIISRSPALLDALDRAERVAPVDTTVLITGETGTGKELMAHHIHRRSRRAARPIVAVNLAAMPDALVAAEMFGHEQGAFTGANQRRIGRFECADRGALFLDEVGELSPEMQIALLRVVQEGEFERLGTSQTRRVDVRLIAATNRSLEQAVDEGRFRPDLYYRLSVFPIHLPPLRERCEDIPVLAEFFLHRLIGRLDRRFTGIARESLDRLMSYSWPGNIRELQNVIEHSAILCDDVVISVPAELLIEKTARLDGCGALGTALHHSELQMIEQALERAEGRVSGAMGAAARLGVPASTLESKIKRYRIDKFKYRTARQPGRDPVSTKS